MEADSPVELLAGSCTDSSGEATLTVVPLRPVVLSEYRDEASLHRVRVEALNVFDTRRMPRRVRALVGRCVRAAGAFLALVYSGHVGGALTRIGVY
ncbi:MAG: hypothetical protein F4Y90_06180 [Rhodothermaceae bacterium]|nr:hypothetical protein [Rhodothermaceae bacterium]MYF40738.1 hypothetical protein [Rhodothermaceae bacterium]